MSPRFVPSARRPALRLVALVDLARHAPAELAELGRGVRCSHVVLAGLDPTAPVEGALARLLDELRNRDVQVLLHVDAAELDNAERTAGWRDLALGHHADGLFIEPGTDQIADQVAAVRAAREAIGPAAPLASRLLVGRVPGGELEVDWLLVDAELDDAHLEGLFDAMPAQRLVVCPSDVEPEQARELARLVHDLGGLAQPLAHLVDRQAEAICEALAAGHELSVAPLVDPVVVPAPLQCDDMGVVYVELPREMGVHADDSDDMWQLAELLAPGTGIRITRAQESEAFCRIRRVDGDPGAYHLKSRPVGITLEVVDSEGLANAVSAWRQLLPDWVNAPAPLPGEKVEMLCVEINDAPRFTWRGMHLDVARHRPSLAFLFRFVDLLHQHRLNRLHLHLTDDQGWRMALDGDPLAARIGGTRPETQRPSDEAGDATPHGGHYTKAQLKALVGYARTRGVVVVPEIDLPGHVRALMAAHPELGELVADPQTGLTPVAATTFGVLPEVLHPSDDVVRHVEEIFDEVLEVFDSPWVHIGGDECPRDQWRGSSAAAALAHERGIDGVDELQGWFTRHLRDWLAERGRTAIGWDEVLDQTEPVDGAVIMAWRGHDAGTRSLDAGHQTVLTPWHPSYFDAYQSLSADEPHAIGGHTPWQHVGAWRPLEGLSDEQAELVLGVQGQLWSEYMTSEAQMEYMALPRMAVLAEIAWNGQAQPVCELEARLRRHERRHDAAGLNHRPVDGPHPWQRGGRGYRARPAGHLPQGPAVPTTGERPDADQVGEA